jgi:KTSC domain
MSIAKSSEWTEHDGSSHIERSKYNPMEHALDIQFANGSIYRYHGVPPIEYKRFLASPSQGYYHADNIKSNYAVKRIK